MSILGTTLARVLSTFLGFLSGGVPDTLIKKHELLVSSVFSTSLGNGDPKPRWHSVAWEPKWVVRTSFVIQQKQVFEIESYECENKLQGSEHITTQNFLATTTKKTAVWESVNPHHQVLDYFVYVYKAKWIHVTSYPMWTSSLRSR